MDSKDLVISPTEFFRTKVTEASHTLKVSMDDEVEFYIVNLLCNFIQPDKLTEIFGSEEPAFDLPLVVMLQKAYESHSADQRLQMLRGLGDTSLYIAGFFQDYFNRKTFDISYYIELGSLAYGNVSELMKPRSDQYHVYATLSQKFGQMVDVVAEVSETHTLHDNKDVLAVYDRWARCQSDRLRKILLNMGIEPIPTPLKIAQ